MESKEDSNHTIVLPVQFSSNLGNESQKSVSPISVECRAKHGLLVEGKEFPKEGGDTTRYLVPKSLEGFLHGERGWQDKSEGSQILQEGPECPEYFFPRGSTEKGFEPVPESEQEDTPYPAGKKDDTEDPGQGSVQRIPVQW